jgi:hypothetical protein
MRDAVRAKIGTILDLNQEIQEAYHLAEGIYQDYGYECVVTSGRDGTHMAGSKHYGGDAIDLRTRHVKDNNTIAMIAQELQIVLGDDYDVVVEGTHIHVEYDPT